MKAFILLDFLIVHYELLRKYYTLSKRYEVASICSSLCFYKTSFVRSSLCTSKAM